MLGQSISALFNLWFSVFCSFLEFARLNDCRVHNDKSHRSFRLTFESLLRQSFQPAKAEVLLLDVYMRFQSETGAPPRFLPVFGKFLSFVRLEALHDRKRGNDTGTSGCLEGPVQRVRKLTTCALYLCI